MVPATDHISPSSEDLVRGIVGEAESGGSVLTVHYDQVEPYLTPEAGQNRFQRPSAWPADYISNHQYVQTIS
jgi:hypothetical protein